MSIHILDNVPDAMRSGANVDGRTKPPVLVLVGIGLTAAVALRFVAPRQAYFQTLGGVGRRTRRPACYHDRCGCGGALDRRRGAGAHDRLVVRRGDRTGDRDSLPAARPLARARLIHGGRRALRTPGAGDPRRRPPPQRSPGRGGSLGDGSVRLRGGDLPPSRTTDRRATSLSDCARRSIRTRAEVLESERCAPCPARSGSTPTS